MDSLLDFENDEEEADEEDRVGSSVTCRTKEMHLVLVSSTALRGRVGDAEAVARMARGFGLDAFDFAAGALAFSAEADLGAA